MKKQLIILLFLVPIISFAQNISLFYPVNHSENVPTRRSYFEFSDSKKWTKYWKIVFNKIYPNDGSFLTMKESRQYHSDSTTQRTISFYYPTELYQPLDENSTYRMTILFFTDEGQDPRILYKGGPFFFSTIKK